MTFSPSLDQMPNGSATANTLGYRLKRWVALTRYLEDEAAPIDYNPVENHIRPRVLGLSTGCLPGRRVQIEACGARGRPAGASLVKG